jgi:hypothetical protein
MATKIQANPIEKNTRYLFVLGATSTIWFTVLIVLLIVSIADIAVFTAQPPVIGTVDRGYSLEAWMALRQADFYAAQEASRQRGLEAWSTRYQGQARLLAPVETAHPRGSGGGSPVAKDKK